MVVLMVCVLAAADGVSTPPQGFQSLNETRVENVFRLSNHLISGGEPAGDEGFAALRDMGVKTIISVDGAKPDIERSRAAGMRYIHIPIGYDGIGEDAALKLAKAVSEATGPIYIHCHHGKHRGPSAAALAMVSLGQWNRDEALAAMERMGASPDYPGLYACVRGARRYDPAELAAATVDLSETAEVPPLAEAMARASQIMERLGRVRAAGWKTPPGHPDIVPHREALQLYEVFFEMERSDAEQSRPEAYKAMMGASVSLSAKLRDLLRKGENGSGNGLEPVWKSLAQSCKACHQMYRNQPVE